MKHQTFKDGSFGTLFLYENDIFYDGELNAEKQFEMYLELHGCLHQRLKRNSGWLNALNFLDYKQVTVRFRGLGF